jgi:hypothetical protein
MEIRIHKKVKRFRMMKRKRTKMKTLEKINKKMDNRKEMKIIKMKSKRKRRKKMKKKQIQK